MRLSSIAFRNVRRHLWRSALVFVVIAASVAVVTSLYLVTRSAERDLENKVDEYGANIVVVPRSEELPLSYGGVQVGGLTYDVEPLHMDDIAVIRGIENGENINLVAPKLVDSAEVGGVRVLTVGVDWASELSLKRWWTVVGTSPSGAGDVLLGDRAARHLGLGPGDPVEVRGERLTVAGVLEPTGTQEDDLLFLDLGVAQRLWDRPDEVSFFEVAAWCATCPIEDINAQISAEMPYARVSAVLKAAESRRILIGQFRLFTLVLSVLMVLVGCLIVLVSTLSSVRARRGEIGIFRSVGYRRQHIFKIILLENLALALVGGLAGLLVAAVVHAPMARAVAQVRETMPLSPTDLALALVASLLVVLAASLYPAGRAAALSPTLAMKRV
ncbi:MAG: ABC transporter permease [Actinobacteria bacterium]|nr:ABC transporter permease [Actinomycetota bacterium]